MQDQNNREAGLAAIEDEIEMLTTSPLYAYRVAQGWRPVIGEGDHDASLMLIGEAPGKEEARQGRPFVGASGRMLDELLASVGLQRADVYITNVVKDRPPDNRDPTVDEVRIYAPFLARQIELIQPRVIATLGRFAMQFVLTHFAMPEAGQKISTLHGRPLVAHAPYGEVRVVPLYHPAVALYAAKQKQTLLADFQQVRAQLE